MESVVIIHFVAINSLESDNKSLVNTSIVFITGTQVFVYDKIIDILHFEVLL